MKEYFYLIGKDQKGPFTIEQLSDKNLTNETLVWTEDMGNWKKLKDIPELVQVLKPKTVPPPPPNEVDEMIYSLKAFMPSKKVLTWFIVWCSFHLFALLTSYSEIKNFNIGEPKKNEFWPFVTFNNTVKTQHWEADPQDIRNSEETHYGYPVTAVTEENTYFLGIFNDYDWTEFAFYVGGTIVAYVLVRVSKKKDEKQSSI